VKNPRSRKISSRSKIRTRKDTRFSYRYSPYGYNLLRIKPYFEDTTKGFRGLKEIESLPRQNQAKLGPSEKQRFVSALKTIIKNGQYAELVSIHTDAATYRIHTEWMDVETNKRFLPWHRVFLHEFESRLNSTPEGKNIRIPYWDWTVDREIPDWLKDFEPMVEDVPVFPDPDIPPPPHVPEITDIHVEREPGAAIGPDGKPVELPTSDEINQVYSFKTFRQFTANLEAYHGRPHLWVGGTMVTYSSPADPLFWLHHANIDRIWSLWPDSQSKPPDIEKGMAEMRPWSYRTDEDRIEDSNIFGYTYE
jgi:tyrosinase